MGTAVTGHGRLYLVTDFVEKLKDPHFVESYDRDIQKYPKSYALKKSDFTTILNALPETKALIRSDFNTMMHERRSAGKPSRDNKYY